MSLIRGATREILAIGGWVIAAFVALYLHPFVDAPWKATAVYEWVWIAILFFATLILVSLATVRLSDAILDSKIGTLDRTVGFFFGVLRGFVVIIIFYGITAEYYPSLSPPDWMRNIPLLESARDKIQEFVSQFAWHSEQSIPPSLSPTPTPTAVAPPNPTPIATASPIPRLENQNNVMNWIKGLVTAIAITAAVVAINIAVKFFVRKIIPEMEKGRLITIGRISVKAEVLIQMLVAVISSAIVYMLTLSREFTIFSYALGFGITLTANISIEPSE